MFSNCILFSFKFGWFVNKIYWVCLVAPPGEVGATNVQHYKHHKWFRVLYVLSGWAGCHISIICFCNETWNTIVSIEGTGFSLNPSPTFFSTFYRCMWCYSTVFHHFLYHSLHFFIFKTSPTHVDFPQEYNKMEYPFIVNVWEYFCKCFYLFFVLY